MVKVKDIRTTKASNEFYASCIILNKVSSGLMNMLISKGMCKLLYMHLQ